MSATTARPGRAAVLALLLASAVVAWSLLRLSWFPHAGVPAGSALFGWMRQLLLVLAALAALLLGRVALRAASDRRTIGAATLGMALAAPFAVDGLLVPLPWLLASAAARRAVFLAASVLVLLLVARSALAALDRLPPLPPSPRRAWLARITTRLAFALLALAAAWGVAEWALGAAGLGDRAWSRPMLFIPGDERSVPLSEVALFRPFDAPAAAQGLSTRWRPYLFIKGWYDRPRWKYFDAHGQVDYAFDEYGLRDHDFALEKAPGEFRVVAIGDSFTFGIGVQLEDCWTEVAERELRTRRGGPVEVINAGFSSGYKASDYEDWILHSGVRLKPDVVVVGFCLNDMHDGISLYAWDSPPRVEQWCGGASRVLNAFKGALDGPTPRQRTMEYTGLLKAEPQQWLADQASLRRVNAALAAQGIRLVVLPFPMFSGLREQPYPYKPLLDMVAAFCDRAGIEHVDLLPRVLGLVDEDLWVHPTDQHPNDVGHRLIGEGLADYLEPK